MSDTRPQNNEGRYELQTLTISTPKGPLDITGMAVRCDIFESILSAGVICELTIADAVGMRSKFNLTEQELCISFTTAPDLPPVHYKFKVFEIIAATTPPNDRGVAYTLLCISEEIVVARTIVNVPLVEKEIEAEKAVKSLLNLVKSKKDLFVEETRGPIPLDLSNITPFEAINKCRNLALSKKYNSHSFVFFENKFGYNFVTLEKLIETNLPRIGDKLFIHSSVSDIDTTGSRWRNILAYKNIQTGAQNVALATGGFQTRIVINNIKTGDQEVIERKSADMQFLTMNNGAITRSAELEQQRTAEGDQGKIKTITWNPDIEPAPRFEKESDLPYFMSQFFSIISHITVYGDTAITLGDIIQCQLPEYTGLTTGEERAYNPEDKIHSGNYMVCKLRHVLTFGEDPRYYQALEIVKDGIGGDTPPVRLNATA